MLNVVVFSNIYILICMWRHKSKFFVDPRKYSRKEVILILNCMTAFFDLIYYSMACHVKYKYGYLKIDDSINGIIATPSGKYLSGDQDLTKVIANMLNVYYMFRSATLLYIIATQNSIFSNNMNINLLSNKEDKIAIIYSMITWLMYPFLQLIFSYDTTLSNLVPQIYAEIESVITVTLILLLNRRIKSHINETTADKNRVLLNKIIQTNNLLCGILILEVIGNFPLIIDVASKNFFIYNKFVAQDCLTSFSLYTNGFTSIIIQYQLNSIKEINDIFQMKSISTPVSIKTKSIDTKEI